MPAQLRAATLALAALLAVACDAQPAPDRGGQLVVAIRGDIDSWNPYTSQDLTSAHLLELLYPRLVREVGFGGAEKRFEPWLATSWSFSQDRHQLTFALRRDARWSDGSAVTCEDVRFTHAVQTDEALAWPGAFVKERITAVECPDPHTVRFRFRDAYADQLLDANDDAIVPAAYRVVPLDAWASTTWEQRAVTCGPFRPERVSAGQEAVLVRDPRWWGAGDVPLDRIVLRVYPDAAAAQARFLEGEVDLLPEVPALSADEIAGRDGLRLLVLPSLAFSYLGWNALAPDAYARDRAARGCGDEGACQESEDDIRRLQRQRPHPILADARVRLALSLAIDRQDLVDALWGGRARPGSSPIVSPLWAHDRDSDVTFDPAGAARLLDAAGWRLADGEAVRTRDGSPLELRVIVVGENAGRRDTLDRVAANLARAGVRVIAEPLARAEYVARARMKSFDGVIGGWWAGTRIEPQNLLHTHAALDRGNNVIAWSTAESDALLDRAAAARTDAEARPLWRAWQALFRREQPMAVLVEEPRLVGIGARVRGPDPDPLNVYQGLHRLSVRPLD